MSASHLSRRERQIMDILHRRGRATVAEVMSELSGEPAYSTVRAQLRVLEEKGHIRHEEEQLRYVYLPAQSHRVASRSALKHVLDTNLPEYIHKAAGVGGVSAGIYGGVRMIQDLLPVLRELGLVTIFWDVTFNSARTRFDDSGMLVDDSFLAIGKFLDELVWMAEPLRHGREHVTVGDSS